MDKVEKIKAEIERLKNELSYNKERLNLREIIAVNNCYNNLIFFIDSLEEPVSEDLEKAAKKYAFTMSGEDEVLKYEAFKEGAQWQKQQMMKDAVETTVKIDAGGYPYIDRVIELYDYDKDKPLAKEGDKVKLIIIMEE